VPFTTKSNAMKFASRRSSRVYAQHLNTALPTRCVQIKSLNHEPHESRKELGRIKPRRPRRLAAAPSI